MCGNATEKSDVAMPGQSDFLRGFFQNLCFRQINARSVQFGRTNQSVINAYHFDFSSIKYIYIDRATLPMDACLSSFVYLATLGLEDTLL